MIKPEPVKDMIARISSLSEQELDILLATLTSYSEEQDRQHREINHSLDKVIRSVKHQLWCWAAAIVVSTFVIVETIINLIH
jgi:hypothetical protein